MNLDLTDEQKLIQDTARNFARVELEQVAASLDHEKDRASLLANMKKLAALGFMGINVKEEYGGAEAGVVAFNVAMTEIAQVCPSTAVTVSVNNLVCEVIQAIGTEEQKRKYIPKICSGEYSAGIFGLTENCTDFPDLFATAVKAGDHYVLNGFKSITNAPDAGVFVVWAVTDQDVPRSEGVSSFLVEAGVPGLTVVKAEPTMGQSISGTNALMLKDCRIPVSALMGKLNEGIQASGNELAGGGMGTGSLGSRLRQGVASLI
jgi:butyryl-CoA dehydrogenase